jgi:hypothetical protein
MKKIFTLIFAVTITALGFSQAPNSMKYQAILRDAAGAIKASTNTTIVVSILQGSATGTVIFTESHSVITNAYGLVNLEIGSVNSAGFTAINWAAGPYFVKIAVDGTEMGTSQLGSVPYAKYAEIAGNGFSGNYNDLTGLPVLSTVATSGSYADLTNTPNLTSYLTSETDPIFNASASKTIKASDTARWSNKSSFSGSYTDLSNKPNLAVYLTTETDPIYNASVSKKIKASDTTRWSNKSTFSGSYVDLSNKPTLATVAGTGSYNDLSNKPNLAVYLTAEADPIFSASASKTIKASDTTRWSNKSTFSGSYTDLSNKPTLATVAGTGSYNDLSNKPNLAVYLTAEADPIFNASASKTIKASDTTRWSNKSTFSGSYTDLSNKPTLATVAGTGSYNDLSNKPNLAVYLTAEADPNFNASVSKTIKASDTTRWSNKSTFSGSYTDLSNKPTLATVAGTGNYNDLGNKPTLATVAGTGDYNDLSNKPTLFNGSYNSLTNKPTLKDTVTKYADGSETKLSIGANTNLAITGTGKTADPYVIKSNHYIGELYGGGIIFWLSPDGQHGLILSLDDVTTSTTWSNITTNSAGSNDMYDGLANSNIIVAQASHTTSAAKLCLDYVSGGFDDWFLPACIQLNQVYQNAYTLNYVLANDGNALSVPLITNQLASPPYPVYWSSTEYDNTIAWSLYFRFGYMYNFGKSNTARVRAIRTF